MSPARHRQIPEMSPRLRRRFARSTALTGPTKARGSRCCERDGAFVLRSRRGACVGEILALVGGSLDFSASAPTRIGAGSARAAALCWPRRLEGRGELLTASAPRGEYFSQPAVLPD
jgi:hypothetical protein